MRTRFRTSLGTVTQTDVTSDRIDLEHVDAALLFVDANAPGVTFHLEAALGEGSSETWGKLGLESVTLGLNEKQVVPLTMLSAGPANTERNPTHICPGKARVVVTVGSADFWVEGVRLL